MDAFQTVVASRPEFERLDPATRRLVRNAWKGLPLTVDDCDGESDGEQPLPTGPSESPSGTGRTTWLSSISVQGFRGIGGQSELLLNPGPGLTLVVGRNGSGKSSFAEGLEALLTGNNLRWEGRPATWQSGWCNLHFDGPTKVAGEFAVEGLGEMLVERTWPNDSFEESELVASVGGEPHPTSSLGWSEALATVKPMLSYNELGSMLEQKPSAIYDSMASALGLEAVTTAREALRQERLAAERPAKEVAKKAGELHQRLESSSDERAKLARSELDKTKPDLDQLTRFAHTSTAAGDPSNLALSTMEPFDEDRYRTLTSALSNARDRCRGLEGTDAAQSLRLAQLLDQALTERNHKRGAESIPCPVCGSGELTADWADATSAEIERLQTEASSVQNANDDLKRRQQEAASAIVPPPSVVEPFSDLHEAWSTWSQIPADGWTDELLLERLGEVDALNTMIGAVRRTAADQIDEAEQAWRPYGEELSAWIRDRREADQSAVRAKSIKLAEDFYKETEAALRNERFQPIAGEAERLWGILRQQSNVSLERVALEGSTTQRRVALDVTVDGTDTSALGVMSQGELHALALALFLPRVTSSESPFRFVLIDDPVQAMDMARVDGLARVLEQTATDRQVIVFTHDDRLPAACRRLSIKAEVVKVHRSSGSSVGTSAAESPASDALHQARTLAKTNQIPYALKCMTVPALCRIALESQVTDLAWRRLLAEGRSHRAIEDLLDDANTTVDILSIWLFGERRSNRSEVYDRFEQRQPGASKPVRFLQRAVHEPPPDLKVDLLVNQISGIVNKLAER